MYNYISNLIVSRWLNNNIIKKDDFDIFTYGIEIIMSSVVGALLVFILGCVLLTPVHSIIFLAIMIPLRCYCGGYHANTYLSCNTIMAASFICTAILSKYTSPNTYITIVGLFAINIIIVILSPVDNPNKRLSNSEKKNCKAVATILSLIISMICLIMLYTSFKYFAITTYSFFLVAALLVFGKIKNRAH